MSEMMNLLLRATATSVGTNADSVLDFWLSLHLIGGHILLPILVFIFVFRTNRHPTLINLCLATIITSICACFLLYANKQRGSEPPFSLCLAQASLASGAQPVLVMTCQALVYQVWSSVFGPKRIQENAVWETVKSTLLLSIPWITFAAFVTVSAAIGFQNPSLVTRNRRFFYCSLDYTSFTSSISIFCGINLLITMAMQASIAYNIYRNWRAVRKGMDMGDVNLSMAIRVICFEGYIIIGLVLAFLSINAPKSPVPDIWLASIGIFIVLIFGTQREVWEALKSWRGRKRSKGPKIDLMA